MLVQSVGFTEAAKRTGIKRDTIYHWSLRYGWKEPVTHAQSKAVKSVKSPPDAHAELLKELERQTRESLAKSAARMSKDAESANLRHSPYVHKVAQTAGIVHNWGANEKNPNQILNVAILTGQEKPEKIIEAHEVEEEGQSSE